MDKPYKGRFQKFSESLSDPELINYARQIGKNTFSRKRKMPLKDMLLCCLSKKGLTTAFELRNYFKDKREVPNSKENRETFGNSGNQHSKTGQVRGMYDILNHFYLDIEIEHISVSENELAKRNFETFKGNGDQTASSRSF